MDLQLSETEYEFFLCTGTILAIFQEEGKWPWLNCKEWNSLERGVAKTDAHSLGTLFPIPSCSDALFMSSFWKIRLCHEAGTLQCPGECRRKLRDQEGHFQCNQLYTLMQNDCRIYLLSPES